MSNNNKIQSIDPIIDKIMNQKSDHDTESDYNKHIPELYEIIGQKPASTIDFYNQFKPLDQILIKPLVNNSYQIMKHLGFKSKIVGFLTLYSFCIGSYFAYDNKDNLSWIFIFFSFFISFFDKLYLNKLDKKTKSKEMLSTLIKLTVHILLSIILKLYILNNNDCKIIKNNIYLLIFIILIIIILTHHTEKIFNKNNIKSKKLLFIKKINISIFLIFIIYIMYLSYNDSIDRSNNNLFDIFLFNDNNEK